jgi:CRISPR-associated protein Cas1
MSAPDELLPVRMLSEFAYCPRLFYLMHVDGRWDDNEYTIEGRAAHRRVDRLDQVLPDPSAPEGAAGGEEPGDERPVISRSVTLASERLGLIAKLDLVSIAGNEAVPVETKRGRVPKNEQRSWEPERVQLMAQGLLLREHGYLCDHGVLYYSASRTRVDVPFDAELEARTLDLLLEARRIMDQPALPRPLEDSPKCWACSLNAVCMPDETLALEEVPEDAIAKGVRRLYPVHDDAQPLYVQEQGATVGKSKGTLIVRKQGEELAQVRVKDVSQLVLCGNVGVSAQALHLLCEAAVPIVHLSTGHWFYGVTQGIHLRNAYDRAEQFRAASMPDVRLRFARWIVEAKGINQRTMLRRNAKPQPAPALDDMAALIKKVPLASDDGEVLGLEGNIASKYFGEFSTMLRPRDFSAEWDFSARTRRPPRDPINALLSFGYALLSKECTVALIAEGLDPWWGLFHRPRHGRPGLALDLMEEFRPVIVDSAVITAVNTGMVAAGDFKRAQSGCAMLPSGRKAFLRAYESRLDQLLTHPIFDYKCTWRSAIRVQARLLARWLRRDVPRYTPITTR